MKIQATEQGLVIPKELLGDSQEFEITKQENQIIITRVNNSNISKVNDSKMLIWDLGKNPVEYEINGTKINVIEELEKDVKQFSAPQNCYDLARSLGIIGIVKDLPSDLSTNPDYFEEFGK